ncbi:DUF4351 domain-containing protein [Clostridium cochlearium]|nr:DUF4351 domain-containing protein [Clostridium cochlearium]
MQKFIPDYEYLIYDISRYTDEEIKGEVQLRILLTIFRDIFTKNHKDLQESIYRAAEYLQKLEDKHTGIEYFETLIKYVFSARADLTTRDINEIIDKIENTYPEGSEVAMTLAEKLRQEGIEKGIEKGREEGETKALIKTAIKLLTRKFGILPEELKMKISKLDTTTLEVIIEGILDYKSLEDVKKYIQ